MQVVPYIKRTNIRCFFLFNSISGGWCKVVGGFAEVSQNYKPMKAPLILLLNFFSGLSFCSAQLYVGPVAGGQVSWTKFDNKDFYDSYSIRPVIGFHGGANISLKVRNRFFLHTAFLYATKGRRVEGKQDPLLTNKVRYDFIEVPVIYAVDFRAKSGGGREFKFYFGMGPTVSYWLGGKGTLYNSDLDENAEYASERLSYSIAFCDPQSDADPHRMYVSEANRIQLGLNVATGLVFEPQPHQRILVMLRYELGHSFLSKTNNGTFIPTYYKDVLQSRNKGLRISASYLIDLRVENRKKGKSTIRRGREG